LSLAKDPDAIIFMKPTYSDMDAAVCEDCGFVHFFARDLAGLIRARKIRDSNLDKAKREELERMSSGDETRCNNCETIHTHYEYPKYGFLV
jgi:hypothetical protein